MTLAALKGPHIDWAGLSPLIALLGGAVVVLLVGLVPGAVVRRRIVPLLGATSLLAAIGLTIWQWHEAKSIVSGALRVDDLALALDLIFYVAGLACIALTHRGSVADEQAGHGEYHCLLLSAVAGMAILVAAQNLVTVFLGLELLSISLYVLCATEMRRETSLESGLKYLIIGSVGSATFLYGLALIYGATGKTDFAEIARALGTEGGGLLSDPLMLTGLGLALVGLAFKASVAPFHQWTPDVYEGAPTPITAFMAVATKAAAFGIFLRFLDVALIDLQVHWAPVLAALAAITIVVGNVGALGQSSLKRILAYSGVAQAGYLLAGVVVGSKLGIQATVFYLGVYMTMNLAAFAVIVAREQESGEGDDMAALEGIGATRPVLAWPMTIAMLSLAGIPATAGFVGKIYLIEAVVDGDYTWLGVVIVIGSMISLGYYLRVIATVWMRPAEASTAPLPAMAGGSPEADAGSPEPEPAATSEARDSRTRCLAILVPTAVAAAATVFFGVIPSPLVDWAANAGEALASYMA